MRLRPPLVATLLLLSLPTLHADASGCSTARGVTGRNPSYAQVSSAIDASSTRRKVPPPLLKAIAWKESGWAQFWPDGRAKVSGDCGVGIMQITGGSWDYRRLAADYLYNVDAGAQVLAAKMRESSANVPEGLKPDHPEVFENWYRAAYRYNGWGGGAEAYADSVFSLVNTPPSGIRPYSPAVPAVNPKSVVRGYRPGSGHGYVALSDGGWRSSLGGFRGPVRRADWLAAEGRITPGRSLEGDQRSSAVLTARNVGWQPWTRSRLTATNVPMGYGSRLYAPEWLSRSRPATLAATTPSGAVGRFSFPVQAARLPQSLTAKETFAPLVDGWLPLLAGRATATWSYSPARAPSVSFRAAPTYVTDRSVDTWVPLSVAAADPSPGAGVGWLEVSSRRVCADCGWAAAVAVPTAAPRVRLAGVGVHEVKVRSVDRARHRSPWSPVRRVVLPHDNTSADISYSGAWLGQTDASAWLRTTQVSAPAGAALTLTATGSSWALIGIRSPGLGDARVYVDGALVAVVPTSGSSTAYRQVLWRGTTSVGKHVLRVEAAGRLLLDAIAVS